MSKIPFSPDELEVIGEHINPKLWESMVGPALKLNTPITSRENFRRIMKRDGSAMWIPSFSDFLMFEPRVNLDHVARAEVSDLGPLYDVSEKGGPDLFGIEWVFVPTVGGSMVKPGSPALEDANDWPEIIKFPDIEALDWANCLEVNAPLNDTERPFKVIFQNGMFERLISFMDFEGAAIALIDDDQKDAVHALFAKLCDMYEAMITKYVENFDLDGVMFHDDWGSQRSPFFSIDTCREMIVPYIKRLVDFCHDKGLWFESHSCGMNTPIAECYIEAGVDMWMPQDMNDIDTLIEKYGDKIILAVYPDVSMDATPEQIDEAAKAFAEKYAPTLGSKPIVMVGFRCPPEFSPLVYKYTRMLLSE